MTALLGAGAALLFGTADFMGGLASRRSAPLVVTAVGQVASVAVLAVAVAAVPFDRIAGPDLGWGAAGGVFGSLGLSALYAALGRGRMSLVAPTTAVVAAAVPVAFDLARGRPLGAWTAAGISLALVVIPFLGAPSGDGPGAVHGRVVALAAGAGLGFGLFAILLSFTDPATGMWPLVGARAASVPLLLGLVAAVHGPRARLAPLDRPAALGAGALDMGANALLLLAIQRGPLAVAAVLSGLYPGVTVLLARATLGERLTPVQRAAVAGAVAAVALIAAPG